MHALSNSQSHSRFYTLAEFLRWRAEHDPSRIAYTYLVDGEDEEQHITFAELDRRARAVAGRLQQVASSNERALLFFPPGLEFLAAFYGCLYAGVIAVPCYPPRMIRNDDRSLPRIQGIARDCDAAFVLTTSSVFAQAATFLEHHPEFRRMEWIATDLLDPELADLWRPPRPDPARVCFLQYTSGSTATPRGVMVSHGNIVHNEAMIQQAYDLTAESVGMLWLPVYHDMGLISCLQVPYCGCRVVLMSPLAFLQRPLRWLNAVSRYKAVISGGPNFAYDLCLRKVTSDQRESLDLSHWRVAFVGAEPVRHTTLERFVGHFAGSGFSSRAFYPCYGLAEATLMVSCSFEARDPISCIIGKDALQHGRILPACGNDDSQTIVGCGPGLPEQRTMIVDPLTRIECPPSREGEVWIAGPSVAQGYWGKPEETAQTFHGHLADTGEGPFLRTGDLGFMQHGELFITGRIKDQIIIDGRNHHPQDIEVIAEQSHPSIRAGGCVAFSTDVDGKERLIVVAEVSRDRRPEIGARVKDAIRCAVSQSCEVSIYEIILLQKSSIPRTSSGKVQRHTCRERYLAGCMADPGCEEKLVEPAIAVSP